MSKDIKELTQSLKDTTIKEGVLIDVDDDNSPNNNQQ